LLTIRCHVLGNGGLGRSAAKNLLFELCTGMPEVRWVEPERFHLTLCFIGAVDDAVASDIATVLQSIEASAFRFTLVGVGHFREHTLWVGVEQPSSDEPARQN
jgi:2'-5' RNA ligase